MTRQRIVFWSGLLMYAVSFLLIATVDSSPPHSTLHGFYCARFAFFVPLHHTSWNDGTFFETRKLEYFSLLISGWINVAYLLFVVLAITKAPQVLVRSLRIVVAFMIPFCWVVFYYERMCPREGHFLWILGMLLTLLSGRADATT